jgi:hypothetical protein
LFERLDAQPASRLAILAGTPRGVYSTVGRLPRRQRGGVGVVRAVALAVAGMAGVPETGATAAGVAVPLPTGEAVGATRAGALAGTGVADRLAEAVALGAVIGDVIGAEVRVEVGDVAPTGVADPAGDRVDAGVDVDSGEEATAGVRVIAVAPVGAGDPAVGDGGGTAGSPATEVRLASESLAGC